MNKGFSSKYGLEIKRSYRQYNMLTKRRFLVSELAHIIDCRDGLTFKLKSQLVEKLYVVHANGSICKWQYMHMA